jgi:hypothetical protein
MKLTTHLLLMPRLRKHMAIHPLPSCDSTACRGTALPFTLLSTLCDAIISGKDYNHKDITGRKERISPHIRKI